MNNRLTGTERAAEAKKMYRKMASWLMMKNGLNCGNFPMRKITEKVCDGTNTPAELSSWYPRAVKFLNGGRK